MSMTYLVGVFKRETKKPLIGVTVAEMDSNGIIIESSGITDSNGFAIINPTSDEFIPAVLVSELLETNVDVVVFPLGGGVGPFSHDYLIDNLWATVVTAGRGTEGQLITTFHGHQFRVYSTIGAAITHGIANQGRAFSVLVVGHGASTYIEKLNITDYSHEIHIYGDGPDKTIIGGNVLSHVIASTTVYFYDLTLDSSVATNIFVAGVGDTFKVICNNVFFRKSMGGKQAGSEYYGCEFELGWVPLSGETAQTITIVGGGASDPFNFQTNNIDMEQWKVSGFKLRTSDSTWFIYRLIDSHLNFVATPTSVDEMNAINIESAFNNSTISGDFKAPPNGASVIDITLAAGVTSAGSKIIATFKKVTATTLAASRFIKQGGAGIARGWHIDISTSSDAAPGNFIEDIGAATHSVEMDNAVGCKFTLTPHDKARVLVNAGSSNILDSGVLASGSTGTTGPSGTIIIQEGDVTVDATANTIDFTEPDAVLVTSSPAGEANINMALYALLLGRSGGQTLRGGTLAGEALVLRANAVDLGSFTIKSTTLEASAQITAFKYLIATDTFSFLNSSGGIVLRLSNTVAVGGPVVEIGDTKLTSNIDIEVFYNVSLMSEGELRLFDNDDSNFIGHRANNARTTDLVYVWPVTDPTAGQVLSSGAPAAGIATLSWTSPGGGSTHTILSATHTDSLAATVVDGDIIIGNVTPAWSRLAIAIPAANVRNTLGIDNGELRPSWKAALDATNPVDIAAAAGPGTSLIFSHRDHIHAHGSGYLPDAHHNAITLAADADTILGLSTQQLTLDTQAANLIFAGPTSGGVADPTFRALIAADIPGSTQTIIITAAAFQPTTTSGATDTGRVEISALEDFYFLDFPDGAITVAYFNATMPDNWDGGTFTARFHWTVNSTSTNGVRWGIQGTGYADGTALNIAAGTIQEVTDNGLGTVYVEHISGATPAVTASGSPGGGRKMKFLISRQVTHADDTLAATARLMEVHIEYTTNAYSN